MFGYASGGDSPTVKNRLAATGDAGAMSQLMASLMNEHQRMVNEARQGSDDVENPKVFRDLVEQLVNEHEHQVAAARRQVAKDMQENVQTREWNRGVSGDNPIGYLWRIAEANTPKKDGPEHSVLQRRADSLREKCDALDLDVERIKQSIAEQEASMLNTLEVLKGCEWGPMEADSRRQVAAAIRGIEADDERLATARFEQLQLLEQTRVTKVGSWSLLLTDTLNSKITDLENAMRDGADGWWNGPERAAVQALEEQMGKDKAEMDDVAGTVYTRLEEIFENVQRNEEFLATHPATPAWHLGDKQQDVYFNLLKDTCELQVLAWKRNHVRHRQFHILRSRWKALRAQVMVRRQHEANEVLAACEPAALRKLYVSVEHLSSALQAKAVTTKSTIGRLLTEANETQQTLRSMKHLLNAQTDALRDKNLRLLFAVLVEDIRLAWLRKEQLQTVELAGRVRAAASLAELELDKD